MADFNQINQFGSGKPVRSGEGMACAECEAMLTDWMDAAGDTPPAATLSARDRAAFELHIATCRECSQMLADAQRGAALLEMLKAPRPEPSAALFDRILAQTSGQSAQAGVSPAANVLGLSVPDKVAGITLDLAPAASAGGIALPGTSPGNLLEFRPRTAGKFNIQAITRTMMQPRFAMTAAMAFFSIALTMNLTGVHLSELKASDLKPSSIRHTFYQADASLVRYYDNLRVVYELESRVSDLKQSNAGDDQPASGRSGSKDGSSSDSGKDKSGQDGNQKHTQPKAGSGTSQRRNPLLQEFKLAGEHPASEFSGQRFDRDSSVAVVSRAVLPVMPNKSREMLQEGELV